MKKAISTTILGAVFSIYYLVMYILSFESYNDGWGTDKSFNLDYFVSFIGFAAILVVGIISIYNVVKKKENNKLYINVILFISLIFTLYNAGLMFKNIAKKKELEDILPYMYLTIFGLYLVYVFIINSIKKLNKVTSIIGILLSLFPLVIFIIYIKDETYLALDFLFRFILGAYLLFLSIINYNNDINLLDKTNNK